MPLVLWDVIRTVELDPFEIGDDSLHFRIEIQQRTDQPVFRTRVWRIEAFQMRPLFPDASRESTEFVLLNDDTYTDPDATSPTADAALALVLAELQRQFG
jgi:hypothetical protein